jgi:hypothetical protein
MYNFYTLFWRIHNTIGRDMQLAQIQQNSSWKNENIVDYQRVKFLSMHDYFNIPKDLLEEARMNILKKILYPWTDKIYYKTQFVEMKVENNLKRHNIFISTTGYLIEYE